MKRQKYVNSPEQISQPRESRAHVEAIPKCTMTATNKYALDKFFNFLLLRSLGVFHILPWAQTLTQGAG